MSLIGTHALLEPTDSCIEMLYHDLDSKQATPNTVLSIILLVSHDVSVMQVNIDE